MRHDVASRPTMPAIPFIDAQIGRLLDALEKHDLMKKTIIVFWSDHGYFLGEKGLWYKRKAFERSTRMPMLIAAPGFTRGKGIPKTSRTTRPIPDPSRSLRTGSRLRTWKEHLCAPYFETLPIHAGKNQPSPKFGIATMLGDTPCAPSGIDIQNGCEAKLGANYMIIASIKGK
jgi:hypothetical protein